MPRPGQTTKQARSLGAVGSVSAASTALVAATFALLVFSLLNSGGSALGNWVGFVTTPPADAGRSGGISTIIVSTAVLLAICLVATVPIGLGAAIWLAERPNPLRRMLGWWLELLAGVPSIVFGLVGNAVFCVALGLGFSLLSGGLTLACMVLPLFTSTVVSGLRTVPDSIRRGAVALGMSQHRTLLHLTLPSISRAIAAGVVLSLGRASAETAALLFTSGYIARMPESPLDSGRALSVHIYDLSMNVPGGERNAAASALTLLLCLFLVSSITSLAKMAKRHITQITTRATGTVGGTR